MILMKIIAISPNSDIWAYSSIAFLAVAFLLNSLRVKYLDLLSLSIHMMIWLKLLNI